MVKNSKDKIGNTYAKAFYDAAVQNKEIEAVYKELEYLYNTFSDSQIKEISNPTINISIKKEIINEINKKNKFSKTVSKSLEVLLDSSRFSYIKDICSSFKRIYCKEKNIALVNVKTVKNLSSSQEKKLKENLEKFLGKKSIINYEISPSILGGLVIDYDSFQIDDSIKGKLNRLEQIMKGAE